MDAAIFLVFLIVVGAFAFGPFAVECWRDWQDHHKPRPGRDALSDDERRELAGMLNDLHQVLTGTGAHARHRRWQVGGCVYCSCGTRVHGHMT